MNEVLGAFGRALRSLTRPSMLWHLIWPTLAALALWIVLGWFFWADASALLLAWFDKWPWLQGMMDSTCLLYTSPSPREGLLSRMPSSA